MHLFHSSSPNLYESDEGFSVEVLGRTGLRYRDHDRSMFIDSEVLMGPSGMAVYRNSIRKWDPPHQELPVSDAERDRITDNLRRTFRFQGSEIDIIG